MDEMKLLQDKVNSLEERLKKLEDKFFTASYLEEQELMAAFYNKALEVLKKEGKVTVISLQKKLLIDFDRAKRLLKQLQENGLLPKE